MIEARSYIRTDEHGVMRVAKTPISLDSVIYAYQQGHAAESIQQQYPALSLEEVYGGIAFYLANKDAVGQYLKGQEKVWAAERAKQPLSPVAERLQVMKRESLQEKK